ncbi:MAG: endonuclease III [Candidatus Woesearchaeota archaeon]
MNKTDYFIEIFEKVEKAYGASEKRLASDGWNYDWQTLIVTIMSAQSRDETTIPIATTLFKKYKTLRSLANAKYDDVLHVLKSLNYNRSKSKHVIAAANYLLNEFNGKVPDTIDKLIKIPGVGRKTANLVLSEVHKKDSITVDVHVHKISNLLGFVNTKNPTQTEFALMKLVPRRHWSRINRLFVLWGKDVPGRDKQKFLNRLKH